MAFRGLLAPFAAARSGGQYRHPHTAWPAWRPICAGAVAHMRRAPPDCASSARSADPNAAHEPPACCSRPTTTMVGLDQIRGCVGPMWAEFGRIRPSLAQLGGSNQCTRRPGMRRSKRFAVRWSDHMHIAPEETAVLASRLMLRSPPTHADHDCQPMTPMTTNPCPHHHHSPMTPHDELSWWS